MVGVPAVPLVSSSLVSFLALVLLAATAEGATFRCDPVKGDPAGDGSAERPWRTIAEVISARLIRLADADGRVIDPTAPVQPGDTVLLRSGWHGVLRIPRGYNDRPITIAAEEGHRPQVGWIEIGEGRNWVVRGLTVSPSLSPVPLERPPRRLVVLGERGGDRGGEGSSGLVIEDCFVYSVLDASAWTAKDWIEEASSGIWLGRHGRAHVARNNYVLNTRFGIELCAPECLCEGNVVSGFSADGIRATRDGQVVRHNVIKNNHVGAKDGDDNHDDGIQVFLFNVGTGTVRGLTISGNIIIAREKDGLPFPNPLQGIGCFDGPLVGFKVEGNVVWVNHWHGVSLYDAQGCTIANNVCYGRRGDGTISREMRPGRRGAGEPQPWVMLGQKRNAARGNTVRNNLAHSYDLRADAEVTAEDNLPVSAASFEQRLDALRASIDAEFGRVHPTARLPRLEREPAEG